MKERAAETREVDTECEVLVEGQWFFGVIAQWRRAGDGAWTAWVRHDSPEGNRISIVSADLVREPQFDYQRGRVVTDQE